MKSQPITITIQVADQWATSTITAKTNYEMSSFEADPDDSYSSASAKLSINLFDECKKALPQGVEVIERSYRKKDQ